MEYERRVLDIDACHNVGIRGRGVTVAILDTGMRPHIDFVLGKNRIVHFFDVKRGNVSAYDINGHGTAVGGIVGGSGLLSGGKFAGVAPECNFFVVKVIDDNGIGDTKSILDGMRYVYANKDKFGIRVACMSFGSEPIDPDPISKGAAALWNAGIVVVASGGNNGPHKGTIKSPGISPQILTVGGVDFDENDNPFVAKFSSRGPYKGFERPDIVAPAVDIHTTTVGKAYTKMSGTSMAAPMIAGAVALMININPDITPDKIKEILLHNTTKVDNDKNASGWGMLNMSQTVNAMQSMQISS